MGIIPFFLRAGRKAGAAAPAAIVAEYQEVGLFSIRRGSRKAARNNGIRKKNSYLDQNGLVKRSRPSAVLFDGGKCLRQGRGTFYI